ncbi:HlyD family efflux transporter periplasmic adaptor subunit [Robiginitalea sp. M366]|uniref:HlyD family secretion protein n=1 Tax=Robiginitalea aestuariiviva TaxID=3036903 RepID=UPI00240E7027|nr:HlyD family efflux transporter periplasmic adaptor subunit [Robiginitalea aestuariiviva]MDG1573289.1 HlyD family efflux transporter periplasmic adaptor subunit [Robiginitalea aestuariiviva]
MEQEEPLRSQEVQEVLSKPPKWIIRYGITIVFFITALILLLSSLIKYPDIVEAEVLVTTSSPAEHIIARSSGALDTIYFDNGSQVSKQDVIGVIRNTARTNDVYQLKGYIDTFDVSKDVLEFPVESFNQYSLGDVGPMYTLFANDILEYRLLEKLGTYKNEIQANRQSLSELTQQLNSQIFQRRLLEQEYNLFLNDFSRYETLFSKGVISQQEMEGKKIEKLNFENRISTMSISISKLRETLSSSNYMLRSTELNRTEESLRILGSLAQNLNALKKAILDWEYSFVLKASIEGKVSFKEFWGPNQFVSAGLEVFTVLPNRSEGLVGRLIIPSQNSGKVKIGQDVNIKLDNYPYQEFGFLQGKVVNKSFSPDSNNNYFVFISIPDGTLTTYGERLPFDQELLGIAEIVTNDLSVVERIFNKLRKVLQYN